MPEKKTFVQCGSMLSSTHLDHVLRTLPYAIGRGTSSYSVDLSSNGPRLFAYTSSPDKHTNKFHTLSFFDPKIRYNIYEAFLVFILYKKKSIIC